MPSSPSQIPERCFFATWSERERMPLSAQRVDLGDNGVMWNLQDLHENKQIQLLPSDRDLMTVALVVAHADRVFPRPKSRWARKIVVDIPVLEFERWTHPGLLSALQTCLATLTADEWCLRFRQRERGTDERGGSGRLPWLRHDTVIPYSGGLDSYAALMRLANQEPPALAVTTGHSSRTFFDIRKLPRALAAWAGARINLRGGNHADVTFRSRGLLFLSLAAVLARDVGAESIVIPETGIGSIGASLSPVGVEYPAQGTHPLFTRDFHDVLVKLWGKSAPGFEHPNLWKAKAELIRDAVDVQPGIAASDIYQTRSCTYHRPNQRKGAAGTKQCGICPNCLLRRSALFNAGLTGDAGSLPYLWDDLGRVRFDNPYDSRQSPDQNDWRVARSGVAIMSALADIERLPGLETEVGRLAVATGLDRAEARDKVVALMRRHRVEWMNFLEQRTTPQSWVRRLAEAA